MKNKIFALGSSFKVKSTQLKNWASILAVPAIFLTPGAIQAQDQNKDNQTAPQNPQCCKHSSALGLQNSAEKNSTGSFEITIPRFNQVSSKPLEIFNDPSVLLSSHPSEANINSTSSTSETSRNTETDNSNRVDATTQKDISTASDITNTAYFSSNNFTNSNTLSYLYDMASLVIFICFVGIILSSLYSAYHLYKVSVFSRKSEYSSNKQIIVLQLRSFLDYVRQAHNQIAQQIKTLRYQLSISHASLTSRVNTHTFA